MDNDTLHGALELNIIAALCWNDELAKELVCRLEAKYFSTPSVRRIADAAIRHYNQYEKPIGIYIIDYLQDDIRRAGTGDLIEQHIRDAEKIKDHIQPDFVRHELNGWIEVRLMSRCIDLASDAIQAWDRETARQHCWEAHNTHVSTKILGDPWGEPLAPAFPIEVLPNVLQDFIKDRHMATGFCPAGYAWTALSAGSTALDGRIRLALKSGFEVGPLISVLILIMSGGGKTPIMKATWSILQKIEQEMREEWKIVKAKWDAEDQKTRGPEPICPRLFTDNPTIESMQNALARQPRGLAYFMEEFAGFIGSMEKYGSKGASLADRAFWLRSQDGGPYNVDRVGRGHIYIPNNHVPWCGSTQLKRILELGKLESDGLLARLCPILTAKQQQVFDDGNYDKSVPVTRYEQLIRRLAKVKPALEDGRVIPIRLSREANVVRLRVERRLREWKENNALGDGFQSFCLKLDGLWGRLTLVLGYVMHVMQTNVNVECLETIDEQAAETAEKLIFDYLLQSAARFYAYLCGGDIEATRQIAGYILAKKKSRLVPSDLTNNVRECRGKRLDDIQKMVSPLEAMGWLTPDEDRRLVSWTVDPIAHEQFRDQARVEIRNRQRIRELILTSVAERQA